MAREKPATDLGDGEVKEKKGEGVHYSTAAMLGGG